MLFIDLMLGSWRNHIFIRKLNPKVSHWVSFKANVANMFMGAVTPFHGGAGPGQLYVYSRHGVKVLDAFIVSLINMGSTLLFMPIAGIFAIFFMNNELDSGLIPMLLRYGFSVFFIFLLAFLLHFGSHYGLECCYKRFLESWVVYFHPKKRNPKNGD